MTWLGTGSYIQLEGQRNAQGVMITRASGNNRAIEEIKKVQRVGQTLDFQLSDSMGGIGLLRVTMNRDGQSGRASWQHATDTGSAETLEFCTTNVLN